MFRYLLRRVLYAVPILVGVSFLTFFLFYVSASPETIARRNLSAKNPSQAQIQQWLKDHHYDKTRAEQFKDHMVGLLTFQFGNSDATNEPIIKTVQRGVGPSFMIASSAFVASILIVLASALFTAYFRGTYVDYFITFLCVLLMSISYVVYVIGLQYLLGKVLRYGPLVGYQSGIAAWKFVLIPVVIAVISGYGNGVRLYRTFFLDEINQDYVRTARAKGVGERAVLTRHVFKNALIPVLTSTVAAIPSLILGSLVLENFFGVPGLGSFLQDAIVSQDFSVVRAMVFLGAVLYIVGLIMTDVAYALADPRVRLE